MPKNQILMDVFKQMEAVSILVILGAPWLPRLPLNLSFIDHPFTRLLLLCFVVYGIRQGPLTGLLAFLAVLSLLIERNHTLLTGLPNQAPVWPAHQNPGFPVKAIAMQPADSHHETHSYEAEDSKGFQETGDGKLYESTEDLVDSNPKLAEIANGEEAASFFEQKGLV